jgi:hypothetical protein
MATVVSLRLRSSRRFAYASLFRSPNRRPKQNFEQRDLDFRARADASPLKLFNNDQLCRIGV